MALGAVFAAVALQASSEDALVPVRYSRLCLSRAVEIRTATCNVVCNSPKRECPSGCVCSPTMHRPSTNLSLAMPSDEYARLVERMDPEEWILATVTSSLNRKAPAAVLPGKRLPMLATLPSEMLGYYSKTWDCKMNASALPCTGPSPSKKNVNVVFSGFSTIKKALAEALDKGGGPGGACAKKEMNYCDKMAEFMVSSSKEASTVAEAKKKMIEPGNANEQYCRKCYAPEKAQKVVPHPFSQRAGMYKGVQFLGLGGASDDGVMSKLKMADFWGEGYAQVGIEAIKDAGFQGVCFDIELTKGEADLVPAFERAFAACKQAGLLVMVTTSHSAPYAAPSVSQKLAIIDSWAKSDDIDIFSPQLYTSGVETEPEFAITQCGSTLDPERTCSYERLKHMKAKWVPSISYAGHYPAVKKFFAEKGITTHGFIEWATPKGTEE